MSKELDMDDLFNKVMEYYYKRILTTNYKRGLPVKLGGREVSGAELLSGINQIIDTMQTAQKIIQHRMDSNEEVSIDPLIYIYDLTMIKMLQIQDMLLEYMDENETNEPQEFRYIPRSLRKVTSLDPYSEESLIDEIYP